MDKNCRDKVLRLGQISGHDVDVLQGALDGRGVEAVLLVLVRIEGVVVEGIAKLHQQHQQRDEGNQFLEFHVLHRNLESGK